MRCSKMATVIGTGTQDRIEDIDERDRQRIIDGLFYAPWQDEVAQFTGVFHYSKGDDSDAIEGLVEDCYGRSRIEGFLSEQSNLTFNKAYHRRPSIEYKFAFDKEIGLYVGKWKGKDAFEGHAVCKLDYNLIQLDADWIIDYFKSFPIMTNEERAKLMIGQMVGEGHLDVSRDQRSAKEMLSLSEKGKKLAEEAEETITPEEKRLIKRAVDKTLEDDDIPF